MLRLAAGAAGVGTVGSLLAACGAAAPAASPAGGAAAPAQQSGEVTISMLGWGSVQEKENVERNLQTFQSENPGITVDWLHTPQDYETKLKTMLAGGTPPDLFWTGNMLDYVVRDQVLDITDYMQADPVLSKPDYFIQPQESDRATLDGRWYGIGSCYVIHHLYYNADMLAAAGVAPPSTDAAQAWTWDEFVEIARQLTIDSAGKHPGESGFDVNNVQQWGVSWATWNLPRDVLVLSNGGVAFTKDGTSQLGDPAAVEAFQALADLANTHQVAPQAANLEQLGMNASQMMASGKLAMLADGSWAVQDIALLGFKFGCGVLPKLKTAVTEAQAHMHVISKNTKNPDAAWKLLAFLSSDAYQRDLCKAGLWLPSHTSLLTEEGLSSWITEGVHPEGYRQIATDYLANHSQIYHYPAGFGEANQLLTTALDPVWIGQAAAADVVTPELAAQMSEALKKAQG
jgi:multiple sugar transport system substrate-binding protein